MSDVLLSEVAAPVLPLLQDVNATAHRTVARDTVSSFIMIDILNKQVFNASDYLLPVF